MVSLESLDFPATAAEPALVFLPAALVLLPAAPVALPLALVALALALPALLLALAALLLVRLGNFEFWELAVRDVRGLDFALVVFLLLARLGAEPELKAAAALPELVEREDESLPEALREAAVEVEFLAVFFFASAFWRANCKSSLIRSSFRKECQPGTPFVLAIWANSLADSERNLSSVIKTTSPKLAKKLLEAGPDQKMFGDFVATGTLTTIEHAIRLETFRHPRCKPNRHSSRNLQKVIR